MDEQETTPVEETEQTTPVVTPEETPAEEVAQPEAPATEGDGGAGLDYKTQATV